MADDIQYITFDEMIAANGGGDASTLTGTLKVDYTTMTVSNTLTAQTANTSVTFSPSSVQMRQQDDGQYLITVGGDSGQGNSITILYNGQDPSQVKVAYLIDGTTYGNTNPDAAATQPVSSSVNPPVCFVEGTLIRTTRGDVRVERLQVGDECVTSSGAARPIRWLGRQMIGFSDSEVSDMPVLVRAGAFRQGLPYADLYLSPGHSVCVDVLGEVLMPIINLVNGTTIVQQHVPSTTYWHVELDTHDVIVANGLPSESYIDCGNRGFFFGENNKPDNVATTADYCRPFMVDETLSRALRSRLQMRATEMGWSSERRLVDVQVKVGERFFAPTLTSRDDLRVATFTIPREIKGEWSLQSSTFVPAHFDGGMDRRVLGLQITDICIDGEHTGLDRLDLEGFDAIESAEQLKWRWTGKSARLPQMHLDRSSSGAVTVEVFFLNANLSVWNAPKPLIGKRPRLSLAA